MFDPIPLEIFQDRTGIVKNDFLFTPNIKEIVSLRNIASVLQVHIMPIEYLKKILFNVSIVGDSSCKVYTQNCWMKRVQIDPRQVRIGQTFVERSKYQKLLEEFPSVFSGFAVPGGFKNYPPMIVVGKTTEGDIALAHYVPTIIEVRKNGRKPKLLDGIHRSYLTRAMGATVEAIMFYDVEVPFPCESRDWEDIRPVDTKPPKEERYFDLKPEFFRDLKSIGIDG
ncbi:MAG: hypothetical protein HYT93_00595 [Parcubacteria group bacterium]|nr:hypothetical protein [Parcubacteria group bacterium]